MLILSSECSFKFLPVGYYHHNYHCFVLFSSFWLNASLKRCFNILIPVWSREKLETLDIVHSKRFVLMVKMQLSNLSKFP